MSYTVVRRQSTVLTYFMLLSLPSLNIFKLPFPFFFRPVLSLSLLVLSALHPSSLFARLLLSRPLLPLCLSGLAGKGSSRHLSGLVGPALTELLHYPPKGPFERWRKSSVGRSQRRVVLSQCRCGPCLGPEARRPLSSYKMGPGLVRSRSELTRHRSFTLLRHSVHSVQ